MIYVAIKLKVNVKLKKITFCKHYLPNQNCNAGFSAQLMIVPSIIHCLAMKMNMYLMNVFCSYHVKHSMNVMEVAMLVNLIAMNLQQ